MSSPGTPRTMRPYRPAPKRPGPGSLIGGIIAIVAIGAGASICADIILTWGSVMRDRRLSNYDLLIADIVPRVALAGIVVACALWVWRWVKRRRGGS